MTDASFCLLKAANQENPGHWAGRTNHRFIEWGVFHISFREIMAFETFIKIFEHLCSIGQCTLSDSKSQLIS